MCEPLSPIEALKDVKWQVSATVELLTKAGSYEKGAGNAAASGINRKIDWVIANLEAANEGQRNMGLKKY